MRARIYRRLFRSVYLVSLLIDELPKMIYREPWQASYSAYLTSLLKVIKKINRNEIFYLSYHLIYEAYFDEMFITFTIFLPYMKFAGFGAKVTNDLRSI